MAATGICLRWLPAGASAQKERLLFEPAQSKLYRFASSPKREVFLLLTAFTAKAPPSGKLASKCKPERMKLECCSPADADAPIGSQRQQMPLILTNPSS